MVKCRHHILNAYDLVTPHGYITAIIETTCPLDNKKSGLIANPAVINPIL